MSAPTVTQTLSPADRKRLATLTARAALRGVRVEVIEGDDGQLEFVTWRWALCRRCATLDEVEAFLARMGIGG